LSDAKSFYSKIKWHSRHYRVADLEGQLRNTIIAKNDRCLRRQPGPLPRYGRQPGALAEKISGDPQTSFTEYGSPWTVSWSKSFAPEELQKLLDQRIKHERARRHGKFTQYQVSSGHPHRRRK